MSVQYSVEPIYSALFDQVSKASGFNTKSRRLKHWSDTTVVQPALFQVEPDNGVVYLWRPNLPPKITFFAQLYIYTKINDPRGTASTSMNNALSTVFSALEIPDLEAYRNQGNNTLGGLAYACRINGKIVTIEGIGDTNVQSLAIIPIEILVTH